jgi:hypothetical protein
VTETQAWILVIEVGVIALAPALALISRLFNGRGSSPTT